MKNLRKNKKFVMGASVALTALMLAAATFAWFSAQDSVDNEFSTGGIPKDSVKVWEIFEKPDEWKPGQEVDKKVAVANLGKEPIFVRATFKELMQKLDADPADTTQPLVTKSATALANTADKEYIPVPSTDYASDSKWQDASGKFTVTGLPTGAKLYYTEFTVDGTTKYQFAMTDATGGLMSADSIVVNDAGTAVTITNPVFEYYSRDIAGVSELWGAPTGVVKADHKVSHVDPLISLAYKEENMAPVATPAASKWVYNTADGWFYYAGTVAGGAVSPTFLDSVTLAKTAGNDYQYMDYTLTVNVEGLQATPEALEQWGITSGSLYDLMVAGIPAP